MTSYFIYYRVAPRHIHDFAKVVSEIQARLRLATGVSGRLLRRDDATDTWMEVYEDVGEQTAFEAELERAVADAKFDTLLADGALRHTERFVGA
jgi:hypothetical protein